MLAGKSKQLQAFLTVFMQCLSLQAIDASFLSYVMDLFNDLSPQEKLEHQEMLKHIQFKSSLINKLASKQLKDQYRIPTQIFHSSTNAFIETGPDILIRNNLIDPLKFPSLNPPKKLFLLYGIDNNGKTAVINQTFRALEHIKPGLIHLRDDGKIWMQHFQNRQEQLNLLIAYFKNITITNPNGWILFEMEHFDEIVNDDMKTFFEELLKLDKFIFMASTSKPHLCDIILKQYSEYLPIFIDLPDVHLIGELLQFGIFKFIKKSDINNPNSIYKNIAIEFIELLQLEIAPQLVCRPSKYIYKKPGRKCCVDAKTQYGITIGELNMNLIPIFLKCLSNARKNWYNSESKCFHIIPINQCSSVGGILNRELILKETQLTKDESITLHKGKLNCDDLKNPIKCQDSKTSLFIDWKWILDAKETVFEIARTCLTDIKENEEQNLLYEELLRFNDGK